MGNSIVRRVNRTKKILNSNLTFSDVLLPRIE